ncbi:RNA-guided endonuclease InsQ/TnpB family protein [Nocardiopsis aegyptia]|uniref:Transposase n=1 Tax=Nocardiopsis aegyptia TaxID=220378 RepID=A0A7Z0EJL0_9ACTN|nr:zinc ribbon domain-containing protein [Nocardiopsis aegyptia]NYJ33162.1 transposase [Nocardiopsis aegyptia]
MKSFAGAEYGDISRAVWNTALDQRRRAVQRGQRGYDQPFCGYHLQARRLAHAKDEEEWLRAAPSHVLQQTLKDLDRACSDHGTFHVRWRAEHRWKPPFRFPDGSRMGVERLGRTWGRLKLPKLGWVRLRWSRAPQGTIRSATVSHDGAHWFVSLLCEDDQSTPEQHERPDSAVGVDRGVAVAVATSQSCNPCGHHAPDNRESPSVFRCGACGHTAHADVNAAKNTLTLGWASPSG